MKRRLLIIIAASLLTLVMSFGCGGSAGSSTDDDMGSPSIGVDDPAGGDEGSEEGDSTFGTDSTDVPPSKALIVGVLSGAEGAGIPNASITFHSDPVNVITDAIGVFEALLEIGDHTFEVTGGAIGEISGTLTVSATGMVDSSGQAIGSFIATVTAVTVDPMSTCQNLQLVDLGDTTVTGTLDGIIQGTFGNEVDSQGTNQTAIIVGNSEMTANISVDGRLSGLWFPTVGAFNHVPYLSKVAEWVKPFQGSFAGIRRGDDYYWLTDRSSWNRPTIEYQSGTYAPIAVITHTGTGDCAGATIKERVYVVYDAYEDGGDRANTLIRDFNVSGVTTYNLCRTSSNASSDAMLTVYSRLNPNDNYQLFRQWSPDLASTSCAGDRMYWTQLPQPHYTIAMEGMDRYGNALPISCTEYVVTQDDVNSVVPNSDCFPLSVIGSIAEWEVPSTRRLFVAMAGCDGAGVTCDGAIDEAEDGVPYALENDVKNGWSSWLTGIRNVSNSTWRDRYKRWLVSMKMLADRNTGAIIASPSQEPTYYYSWPRDGVFQAVAYIMARKYDEAADFFNYLFDMAQGDIAQGIGSGWTQAHSSLDGSKLGLPPVPLRMNVEEDQPPTVLWGLWVYWKQKSGNLPSGIDTNDVIEVADYVVSRICPTSGLIWPSLDWHENPYKDIGQSLYTNAAAFAGLLSAAEMVEAENPGKAADYREAANAIREGVYDNLCDSDSCHTRIKYSFALIGNLWNSDLACLACLSSDYSDDDGEHIMAFAWPFHLFELGDPRVQSYYSDTWGGHDDLGDFSKDHSLWIPRYLYSYLYARAASVNEETTGLTDYREKLSDDISDMESSFTELMTETGYLMDQHIDGEESLIYSDYDGSSLGGKLGSAARPLGWSQAMGILYALARQNSFVPLLDPPPPPADCTAGSGPCCDDDGYFRPTSYLCDTATEYGCPNGTGCGSDVKKRSVNQYCSGTSAECTGATTEGGWSAQDYCSVSEMCVPGNPACQPCVCVCTSGACCNGCTYKAAGTTCYSEEEYDCTGPTCGGTLLVRTHTKECTGASATCDGTLSSWSDWATDENCDDDEMCSASDEDCVYEGDLGDECFESECTSGTCCNSTTQQYRPAGFICDAESDERCAGSGCGANAENGVRYRRCTGESSACPSTWDSWIWSTKEDCTNDEKCSTSTFTCETSSACCSTYDGSIGLEAHTSGFSVMLTWNSVAEATGYYITRIDGYYGACPPDSKHIHTADDDDVYYHDMELDSGDCATYGIKVINDCGVGACAGIDLGCMP